MTQGSRVWSVREDIGRWLELDGRKYTSTMTINVRVRVCQRKGHQRELQTEEITYRRPLLSLEEDIILKAAEQKGRRL